MMADNHDVTASRDSLGGQPTADTPPRPPTNEETMKAALAPFGWTCTEEFWRRYYTDAWVFNLANAVERLTEENARPDTPPCPPDDRTRPVDYVLIALAFLLLLVMLVMALRS